MATTTTVKSNTLKEQQKPSARPGSAPADEPARAAEGSLPSEGEGIYWGDRFAFKVWLIGFLLMALMVAYDAIIGLMCGLGSN